MSNRVIENEDLYEAWKNEGEGIVFVKRVSRTGELTDEMIAGGKTIHLTPAERRLNEELFAEVEYNFFRNGVLSPVKLIEDAADVDELKGNPNHLTEDDLRKLFKDRRATKAFEERIAQITNPIALKKLIAIASDEDASLKQLEIVKARMEEVAPSLYSTVETVAGPAVTTATS